MFCTDSWRGFGRICTLGLCGLWSARKSSRAIGCSYTQRITCYVLYTLWYYFTPTVYSGFCPKNYVYVVFYTQSWPGLSSTPRSWCVLLHPDISLCRLFVFHALVEMLRGLYRDTVSELGMAGAGSPSSVFNSRMWTSSVSFIPSSLPTCLIFIEQKLMRSDLHRELWQRVMCSVFYTLVLSIYRGWRVRRFTSSFFYASYTRRMTCSVFYTNGWLSFFYLLKGWCALCVLRSKMVYYIFYTRMLTRSVFYTQWLVCVLCSIFDELSAPKVRCVFSWTQKFRRLLCSTRWDWRCVLHPVWGVQCCHTQGWYPQFLTP